MPIRLRLTLWYLATLLVLLLLFATYFISQAYFTLLKQTDQALMLAANQAVVGVEFAPEPMFIDEIALREAVDDIDNDLAVMIVDAGGVSYQHVNHGTVVLPEEFMVDEFVLDEFGEDADAEEIRQRIAEIEAHAAANGVNFAEEISLGELVELEGFEADGSIIFGNMLPTVVPLAEFETVQMDGTRWRFHSQQIPSDMGGEAWIQVAQSLELIDDFWRDVTRQMLWSVPLALLFAGLIGYWMAQRALSPIAQITATAQKISAHDLDRRIDYAGAADEVGRLAQTMDGMFNRLQNAFNRERRFTGDAAHELRTPLTALKGKIEVTLSRERAPEEYATAVASMGEQVDRLIRLSNDLLFMARFDQEAKTEALFTTIDVADLLQSVIDQLQPLADQKGLRVNQTLPTNLTVRGNFDLLTRLFLNLLDNAIKYTPAGGMVSIGAQHSSSGLQVQIQDTGIGIPQSDLPHLFTRFYRVEQDRARNADKTNGSGLGLSIAQEIVEAHSGTISAASTPGEGTTITVSFPSPF